MAEARSRHPDTIITHATIIFSIQLLVAYNIWLDDEALFKWSDKMIVLHVTEGTSDRAAVLAEEVESAAGIEDRATAMLARQPLGATRHRGEDVVGVHGADDEAASGPRRATCQTLQTALETAHAHRIQVEQFAVKHHLRVTGKLCEHFSMFFLPCLCAE